MRTTGDSLGGGGGSDNDRMQFDGSSSGAAEDMLRELPLEICPNLGRA